MVLCEHVCGRTDWFSVSGMANARCCPALTKAGRPVDSALRVHMAASSPRDASEGDGHVLGAGSSSKDRQKQT